MEKVLLNISGHPLSKKTISLLEGEYSVIEDVKFGTINFNDNIVAQIKNILDNCKSPIDGSIPITLIPPGQSTFAIMVFVYLHGLLGYPPNICYLELDSDNVFTPKTNLTFTTNDIKMSGRSIRQEKWGKNLP